MRSTFYRVKTDTGGESTHNTEQEARQEVQRLRDGCPDKPNMSKENKDYWRGMGKTARIIKVVQVETLVKV